MDDVRCSMRILCSNCPLTNDSNDEYFVFLNLKVVRWMMDCSNSGLDFVINSRASEKCDGLALFDVSWKLKC